MRSRYFPDGPPPVISSACARYDCQACETPHCGCACHLSNLTDVPDGR
jgi:hypothetical protein